MEHLLFRTPLRTSPSSSQERGGAASPRLLSILFLAGAVVLALGAAPQWWADQGVLTANPANDYASVNAGQLKNTAKQAYLVMQDRFPAAAWSTPAGSSLGAFVQNLSTTNNYAPVNLGQAKTVAKPFYDVLIENSIVAAYPWSNSGTANDYALANIGQVKNLFSFALPALPTAPPDSVTDVIANTDTPGEVDLSWTNPAGSTASSILVQQQNADGSWATVATLAGNASSYLLSGLSGGQSYVFRVIAANAAGNASPASPAPTGSGGSSGGSGGNSGNDGSGGTSVHSPARYAIIDLGAGLSPSKITNSGYVLLSKRLPDGSYPAIENHRWQNGTDTQLQPPPGWTPPFITTVLPGIPNLLDNGPAAYDIAENGIVVGSLPMDSSNGSNAANKNTYFTRELVWPADSASPAVSGGMPPEMTDNIALISYGTYFYESYDGIAATDGTHFWSIRSVPGTYRGDTDAFKDGSELGNVYGWQSGTQFYVNDDPTVRILSVNTAGQALMQNVYSYSSSTNLLTTYTVQTDTGEQTLLSNSGSTLAPPSVFSLSNPNPADGKAYVAWSTGIGSSATISWRATSGTPSGALGSGTVSGINARSVSDGTNLKTAVQIVGKSNNVGTLWEMDPATGSFGKATPLDSYLPSDSTWSQCVGNWINDNGVIAGTASLSGGASHGVLLLPVQLVNLADPAKGHANLDTPIAISTSATKDLNSIAWIAAHDPMNGDAPRMPKLRATIAAPVGCKVLWKLQVVFHDRYNHPYRDFDTGTSPPAGSVAQDTVSIPKPSGSADSSVENGWHKITDGTPWDIYQNPDWTAAVMEGFFGGDAILSVKIVNNDGSKTILPQMDWHFRIAGENPDPVKCKAYIRSIDQGAWWAYAIAKHETKGEGGRAYYNQFLDNGGSAAAGHGSEGKPNWHNDTTSTGSGGYGLFQLTYAPDETNFVMRREWIWNWQKNVQQGISDIDDKTIGAINYLSAQRTHAIVAGAAVPIPKHTTSREANPDSGDTDHPHIPPPGQPMQMIGGDSVYGYPAATAKASFYDSDLRPSGKGELIEVAQSIRKYNGGNYVAWNGSAWVFRRARTNDGKSYVDLVSIEIEPPENHAVAP